MKAPVKVGIALSVIGVVGVGVLISINRTALGASKVAKEHPNPLIEATTSPKSFIAKNERSKDIVIQTAVTRARMTEAYDLAKKKDFKAARAEFIEASYKHKGTVAMNPEFGTLSDQAAYQAIVCLDASGKKDEAAKEYRKFISERQLSPLIHACSRRLERLNGGVLKDSDQTLLESGIAAQEKRIKFETSVCGPKCLEKILPRLGIPSNTYKDLAKLCKTTDQGTTFDNLQSACKSLGLQGYGLELNMVDFKNMKKPFIWLQAEHYVAILDVQNDKYHFFDPRFALEDWKPLPREIDPNFRATVLAFELPTSDLVSDTKNPSKKS